MRRGENGIALFELLAVIGIVGAIVGVIALSMVTLYRNHQQAKDEAIALQMAQSAGGWMTQDITMAKDNSIIAMGGVNPLKGDRYEILYFEWRDWEESSIDWPGQGTGGGNHTITYYFATDTGIQEFYREHTCDIPVEDVSTLIATNIEPDQGKTYCDYQNDLVTIVITASVNSEEAAREYKATTRGAR